jgi:hypothetical protein
MRHEKWSGHGLFLCVEWKEKATRAGDCTGSCLNR